MTIRRELIDELLKEYPTSRHNRIKGLGNRSPPQHRSVPSSQDAGNKVIALPVVGGLHHHYRWAA